MTKHITLKQSTTQNRRTAIQQLLTGMAGLSLLGLPSGAVAGAYSADTKTVLSGTEPFYIPPAAPLQPGPGGLDIRTLIHSAQTNMQFSCVEFAVAARKMGPAPHYHKELDELMYVLEGTATVMVEDRFYEIPAGGWHFRPHGKVHTFFNKTDQPFRGIDMYFNQNFEDYLEELIHQLIPEMLEKKLTPEDPGIAKRMHDLHERFGIVGYPEKRQGIIEQFNLIA
ncbi:MAG: cupin domain-containing protein [Chitinophagales bacterium]|nr:cupin domain-containing protein [Chitinophagales bacterium]